MAFRGQIETIERLGGRVIALDAQHNDQTQIIHIRTLIAKRPQAIIEQLGNIEVLNPWRQGLKRIRDAGIPLFTVCSRSRHHHRARDQQHNLQQLRHRIGTRPADGPEHGR